MAATTILSYKSIITYLVLISESRLKHENVKTVKQRQPFLIISMTNNRVGFLHIFPDPYSVSELYIHVYV